MVNCYVCEQGIHDECLASKLEEIGSNGNIFSIPGIYWICEHCDTQYEDKTPVLIEPSEPEPNKNTQPTQSTPKTGSIDVNKDENKDRNSHRDKRLPSRNLRSKPSATNRVAFGSAHELEDDKSDCGNDEEENHRYDDFSYDEESDNDYEIPVCIHYKNGK